MARNLAVIAGAGLAISAVCLGVAAAFGGGDFPDIDFDGFPGRRFLRSCGEGNTAFTGNTREIVWDADGDEVSINVPATVTYRPGTGTTLIATGPAEALSHLRVRDGRIEFDCRGLDFDGDLALTLPGRPLSDFVLNGSGTLILENINQRELRIAIRGGGDVRATGTAEEVDISIAGSGDAALDAFTAREMEINIFGSGQVVATGTTEELDVNIAGSGDANLGALVARRVSVNIAGSGDAAVAPQEEAEINIAGSGDVRFLTQPQRLETHIAGSGNIVNVPAAPAPVAPAPATPAPATAPAP